MNATAFAPTGATFVPAIPATAKAVEANFKPQGLPNWLNKIDWSKVGHNMGMDCSNRRSCGKIRGKVATTP